MAAPDLRVVRRPRGQAPKSLVAASSPIDNPGKTFKNQVALSGRIGWQTEAWEMLDQIGELRYYVSWRSNACSRVRLVASELDEVGMPTGKCANTRVSEIANKIANNALGQGQLIKRTVELLTVVGEAWIAIIYRAKSPLAGEWFSFSRDEIRKKGQRVTVELPDGTEHDLNTGTDTIFRVWTPHPRKAKDADSPVRASMDALHEIVLSTRKIRNADRSRLIGNGVVFVPQEMSLPMAASPVTAARADGSIPDIALSGIPAVQELQELLFNVAKVSFEDEDSFAAMIPIFASVPGDQIPNIQHLKFGDEITDQAIKIRNDAIARLAMGLEVSPERLLGLGSSTNHWSAWQIGDNDVQMHIAPAMEVICQAITDQVFYRVLDNEGIDPEKYLIWYDASQLTADPDKSSTATDAFDRGVITADAYREFLGLGDSGYNLNTGGLTEWQRWAVDKVAQNPEMIRELMPLLDSSLQSLEFPTQAEIAGTDGEPGQADTTNEGNDPDTEGEDPGYDQGKRGRKKDVAGSQAIIELLVGRALELAGKRRRNRSNVDRLRGLRPHHFHRVMGPVGDADIPALIDGWDAALEADTLALVGLDIDGVRAEVKRQVRLQLTAKVVNG